MVKLRLRRKGRIRKPFYDIVAIDSRKKRDGAFIEQVGTFDPMTQPSTAKIDHDRAMYWLGVGAQPTDRVRAILSFDGVLLRRNLLGKGKPADEVEAAVVAHREQATKRYHREKYNRKKKAEDEAAAIEAAKLAAEQAAEAEKRAAEQAAEAAKAAAEQAAAAEAAAATP
ncbi:MAG: 30S ribosomal protein S16, partial [Candidatus Kapaibacterium sp.]